MINASIKAISEFAANRNDSAGSALAESMVQRYARMMDHSGQLNCRDCNQAHRRAERRVDLPGFCDYHQGMRDVADFFMEEGAAAIHRC